MRTRVILLFWVLGACRACTGEQCETKSVKAGNCTVKVKECACLFFPDLKYKATASCDGKSADEGYTSSKDEAYEKAVETLFGKKLMPGDPLKSITQHDYCNCQQQDQPVGNCTIRATVCGYFDGKDDVKKAKISYRAWAADIGSKKSESVDKQKDPVNAAVAAFTALTKKYPSENACVGGTEKLQQTFWFGKSPPTNCPGGQRCGSLCCSKGQTCTSEWFDYRCAEPTALRGGTTATTTTLTVNIE